MDSVKYCFEKPMCQNDIGKDIVIIDFVGIDTGVPEFVCKEMCLIDGDYKFHKIFKSPYSFDFLKSHAQESVLWDISHFCGIAWKSGTSDLGADIICTLNKRLENRIVILESEEKVLILKDIILKNSDLKCVSLKKLKIDLNFERSMETCGNHNEHNGYALCNCASTTASQIKHFVDINSELVHILINTLRAEESCHLLKEEKNEKTTFDSQISENACEKKKYVFIDFVEFYINDNLRFCKEFCLIDGDFILHNIIESSGFENLNELQQESILWETMNKNGLRYNSGILDLESMLQSAHKRIIDKRVIVENKYKAEYLKLLFQPHCEFECVALEELGFELDYDERPKICGFHTEHNAYSHCQCASSMTKHLKNITMNNLELMDILINILKIKEYCYRNLK